MLVLAGCSDDDAGPGPPTMTATPSDDETPDPPHRAQPATSTSPTDKPGPPRVVDTIATGLRSPWGLAFLPDGTAVVTERDTRRVLTSTSAAASRQIGTVAEAAPQGEAGLLGVAVLPDLSRATTCTSTPPRPSDNRVVRAPYRRRRASARPRWCSTASRTASSTTAAGSRSAPTATSTCPPARPATAELAQDRGSLGGKILRITPDGDPAPGNPDPDSPIWTLGHRNVQGLAFDDDGRLWASEFGDTTFDELNLIQKGRNYGWPRSRARATDDDYINPQVVWDTDEASPSGLAFARRAALAGRPARRAAVADRRQRRRASKPDRLLRRRLRPAAHRRRRPRRQPVGDHLQPRRPRRPRPRRTTGSWSSLRADRRPA